MNMPTEITFSLDESLDVKEVFLVIRQIFGEGGETHGKRVDIPLSYKKTENGEDVFYGKFTLENYGIYKYRFEGIFEDGTKAFFGRDYDGTAIRGDWLPEWQLTVTKSGYKTPNWAKHGVIYQIFADRFCKAGENKFIKSGTLHDNWDERPCIAEDGKDYKADDFFGGNIAGIIGKLNYLKSLGVTCIYLSPIFKSSSNHRYDTGDYLKIDELFGTEAEFKKLVKEANARGIKIILDGVFNHTGADSLYFNKFGNYDTVGAYQSKESPYYDWYTFQDYPDKYACWWGSTVVPTVNKNAEGFKNLLFGKGGVIDKWSDFGIAGWRLDVVDELPVDFTDELCRNIKAHGNDMLIVGEVWEDASVKVAYDEWRPYFMGEQLDSVMNYPFKEAILNYVSRGDVRAFAESVTNIIEHYPKENLDTLMNLIGSHDTVRALTALSGVQSPESKKERADFKLSSVEYEAAKKRLKLAATLQYTLPGVPCVYYGDEAGVQGFEDPLNRGTYPWGREDNDLVNYYSALGKLREEYADALAGETTFIRDGELVIFKRRGKKQTLCVLANASDSAKTREIDGVNALTGEEVHGEVTVPPLDAVCLVITATD